MEAGGRAGARAGPSARELPLLHLIELSVYWFGISIIWGGLDGVIVPARLEALDPANFGLRLAIITGAAVLMAIVVQPTVGMISDYTSSRWGRRKPYIVIGALLDVVFLLGVASSQDYLALLAFLVLLQFSSNFAQGPFQGYVPDLVPARQVGLASGLMGLMLILGRIAGVAVGTVGVAIDNLWIATMALGAVEVFTMLVLVASVHEGTAGPPRTTSFARIALSAWGTDILREANVLWLLLVRLLFLGAVAATNLGLIYFSRSHGLEQRAAAETLLIGTVIVGVMTAAAAIPGGRLSDRFGRKRMIWAACSIAAIGMVGVAVAPVPAVAIAAFVPFGLGVGIFLAVDWALMTDVIPKHTSGRYMGILNAGTAAAGPVYLFVAGLTLDRFSAVELGLGPRVAMLVAVVFLGGAALALARVDARRRELTPARGGVATTVAGSPGA
jgi:MFS family permease